MSMNDTLADMLTRIRNGQSANLTKVECLNSKLNRSVLEVLKIEGYIQDFQEENQEGKAYTKLTVTLRYHAGKGAITMLKRISKPGRRMYISVAELLKSRVYNGLGISVLSTNKGVMSDIEARRQNVGGELLCNVF